MRITRIFLDADMRQNFDGLRALALKEKSDLNHNSVILLLNRKKTYFKMLVGNKYLVYYRHEKGRIPIDAIQFLPKSFGGSEAEMSQAIKKLIEQKIERQK